jgi:UDP-N-acetylglucosamine--N-acetylmuramyl-(pentapeptide) pyrophosphoryl-undecaprenol N-acetylglucosamine transferase
LTLEYWALELLRKDLYTASISPRILFIGGGSGGHIMPLIAVSQELKRLDPKAVFRFVCSQRLEDAEYLRKEHHEPDTLRTPRRSPLLPFVFLSSYRKARLILGEFQPDVIFSKGGAVSIPLCMAAKHRGIPIVLHESDAVMGRANGIISRWADVVCVGLESSTFDIRHSKIRTTGNPVRPEITKGSADEARHITGFSGKRPVTLVYGGSQGSQALNEWVVENLKELLTFTDVIHLTGKGKKGATPREGYYVAEFAHGSLGHLYTLADIAVSRAGSGNITELAANGIPAILVPLRGLAQDHQELNARAAEKSGGCRVVQQIEIQGKLSSALRVTLEDPKALKMMSERIRSLYRPEAALTIATAVLEAAEKHLPRRGKTR